MRVATRIARAITLIAVGLPSGNEFGSLLNVHPAFDDLDLPTRTEHGITRRYGKTMPSGMSGCRVAGHDRVLPPRPVEAPGSPGESAPSLLDAGGTACFVAMLAVTLIGNIPITRSLLRLAPGTAADATFDLRTRIDILPGGNDGIITGPESWNSHSVYFNAPSPHQGAETPLGDAPPCHGWDGRR